jgi:ring-1,2-phenylacetyl-CoA epoxidase subunit PaaD
VEVRLSPAWTSERSTESGRQKLKEIGLAPPERVPANGGIIALDSIDLLDGVECPFCNSRETVLESAFGPTMCRSLYYCHSCQQPFEKFKAL